MSSTFLRKNVADLRHLCSPQMARPWPSLSLTGTCCKDQGAKSAMIMKCNDRMSGGRHSWSVAVLWPRSGSTSISPLSYLSLETLDKKGGAVLPDRVCDPRKSAACVLTVKSRHLLLERHSTWVVSRHDSIIQGPADVRVWIWRHTKVCRDADCDVRVWIWRQFSCVETVSSNYPAWQPVLPNMENLNVV